MTSSSCEEPNPRCIGRRSSPRSWRRRTDSTFATSSRSGNARDRVTPASDNGPVDEFERRPRARARGQRADYDGPTGAQTALAVAFAERGTPAVGLWAQVPHYLSGATVPPAMRALFIRLAEVGRLRVDAGILDAQCEAWLVKVEESVTERPEVAELVEQIEAAENEGSARLFDEDLPSGEELASEIERFLREER
ncbi:MAG: PAC2 family protein [Acidimicrobiia bacterium]|nr:PAC2 family protein [Acidimicrobiia bacterium]